MLEAIRQLPVHPTPIAEAADILIILIAAAAMSIGSTEPIHAIMRAPQAHTAQIQPRNSFPRHAREANIVQMGHAPAVILTPALPTPIKDA